MVRSRRSLAVALAAACLLAFAVGSADAASPKAQFSMTICQVSSPIYDDNGVVVGYSYGIDQLFSWSGANVNMLSGSWTRSDGGDAGFGFVDTDFTASRAGTVNAGVLGIVDDPAFDGITGSFYWHGRLLHTVNIPEPADGWTSVAPC